MDVALDVRFRSNKYAKAYEDRKSGTRLLGAERHRKYVQRVNIISQAQSVDELSRLPGLRWHALKGNRAGQYGVTLTGNYRLVLTLVDDDPNAVCVEEVTDYHGD